MKRRYIISFSRVFLCLTFVLSGFVKAVDPLGTAYKITDYLKVMNLSGVLPEATPLLLSASLCTFEFLLGWAILLTCSKWVCRITWSFLFIMTLFTVWIAVDDPVSDCGCFGDAIVLTNTQTLLKNVVLLGLASMLSFLYETQGQRRFSYYSLCIPFTIIIGVMSYSLYYLPLLDFRPYRIGADLRKGMSIPADAPKPRYETSLIYEKEGRRQSFTLEECPDSTWTFIETKVKQVSAGYVPPIHDFSILTLQEHQDITSQVLAADNVLLVICPRIEDAQMSSMGRLNTLYDSCNANGVDFYVLTSSTQTAIDRWQEKKGTAYPFCQTDGTTLKTIIRSNPGIVWLQKGVVRDKWSCHNIPLSL